MSCLEPSAQSREWKTAVEVDEVAELRKRREKVFPGAGNRSDADAPLQTVGLAMSGGGARSAAFNLGLIQAFHRRGLLRWVDYLSCVSGGSYAGAMVSEAMLKQDSYRPDGFLLKSMTDGPQPPLMREVAASGNNLFRIDLMANRYVIGLLLNLIPILSGLIAAGALIAFLWRLLDLHIARHILGGLGINNDYIPALLPAMVVLSVWCLMYSVALAIKSEPLRHVTHRTFWFGMACVAIGLAILLGNGDITLQVQSPSQVSPGSENRWTSTNVVSWVLLGLGLLGLVPLCVPKQLLRSGQSPRHPVESWIFYYTSFVLFLGIPLTAVWWFGRENVSRFATYRGPELRYGDIKQTDELCQLLRKAMPGKDEQGVQILVTDLPLSVTQKADAAAPKAMRIELGFPESLADDKSETERIEAAIKALEQAQSKSQRAAFELGLGSAYPRRQPWDEMKTPLENINQQAGVPQSDARSWITWRYFSPLPRLCSALAAPLHAEKTAQSPPIYENDFREYMAAQQGARLAELELLDVVNPALFAVGSEPLLKFDFDGATATTERQTTFRIPASRLPGGARELLIHEALRLDPQRKDLVAEAVTPHERGELNRAVLEAAFPELIRPRSERRRSTLIDRDQWHRGLWAGLGLAVWLLGAAFISPNTTCLHDWYRDRLAATYLPFTAPRCDVPFPENGSTRLHNLQPHLRGGPFPLFVAASSLETPWRHARQLSAHFKPYIMTPLTCGSRELGVRPTNDDGGPLSELTTADAMAISAAALSPNYFVHHIFMALMALLNWRLGLWLPNPQGRKRLGRTPTLLQLLWDEWRTQWRHRRVVMRAIRNTRSADPEPLAEREFLLVTDGGHCENLGLEALLERRCDFIFVSDAGADPLHTFDDFARLRRRYEAETGVRFVECQDDQRSLQPLWELPCRGLSEESGRKIQELKKLADGLKTLSKAGQQDKPLSHDRPPRHFFVGKIIYPRTTDHPAAKEGWLVYIKPCLTGDENLIVQNFAANNDLFPHEPTTDQAFSYEQFEAYRVLGCHTGEDVALGIANRDGEFWKQQHSIESLKQHYGKTLPEQQLYVDAATADDVPAAKPAGSQRRQPAAKAPTGAGDEKIYYAELADQLSEAERLAQGSNDEQSRAMDIVSKVRNQIAEAAGTKRLSEDQVAALLKRCDSIEGLGEGHEHPPGDDSSTPSEAFDPATD